MFQVLMVEDDSKLLELVQDYLKAKSKGELEITVAKTGSEGADYIDSLEFDLIILDVMLPGINGFELCKKIRKVSSVPILFVTARGREEDMLYGYDLGADDYMVKPFSLAELFAKVYALLKRSKGIMVSREVSFGLIRMNYTNLQVCVEDREVDLSSKQFALLKYLMEHKGVAVSRDSLLNAVWGMDFDGSDRAVDTQIQRLRTALGPGGKQIKTVFGKGYKLIE